MRGAVRERARLLTGNTKLSGLWSETKQPTDPTFTRQETFFVPMDRTSSPAVLITIGIFVVGIALRLIFFSFWNFHHPDGLIQYLEQAHRLVVGRGLIPWEYRKGMRSWLMPLLLTPGMALGEAMAPGGLLGAYLARLSHAMLGLMAIWAAWRIGRMTSLAAGLMAALVVACWYESVLFSVDLLSETAAAPLMLAGAAWLASSRSPKTIVLAGAALTGASLLRFQWTGFAGLLALATLRADARGWLALIGGALPVLVLGAGVDVAMGEVPFGWVTRNFSENIGAGQAAHFGTAPWWDYGRLLWLNFGQTLPFVIGGALMAGRRHLPLAAAAVANVALHSLIGHKEFRFIWVSVLVMLVLAAIGTARVSGQIAASRQRSVVPILLATAALWLGLSVFAYRQTGGEGAFRGGGQTGMTLYEAAHWPGICGVMLSRDLMLQAAPVQAGSAIPIYVAPKSPPAASIPTPLLAAANAYVSEAPPPTAQPHLYARAACHTNNGFVACLYIRRGGCTGGGGAPYTQQASLDQERH